MQSQNDMDRILIGKALYVVNKEAKGYRDVRNLMKRFLFKHSMWEPENIKGHQKDFITHFGLDDVFSCEYDVTRVFDYRADDNLSEFVSSNIKDLDDTLSEIETEHDSDVESYNEDPDDYDIDEIEENYREDRLYYNGIKDEFERANDLLDNGHQFLKYGKTKQEYLYDLKGCVLSYLNLDVAKWHSKEGDSYNWYPLYRIGKHTSHRLVDKEYAKDTLGITEDNISSDPLPDEISSQSYATDTYPSVDEALSILQGLLSIDIQDLSDAAEGKKPSVLLSIDLPPVGHTPEREYYHGKGKGRRYQGGMEDEYYNDDENDYWDEWE